MSKPKTTPLERVLALVKQEPLRLTLARIIPDAGLGAPGDHVQAYVVARMLYHLEVIGFDGRRFNAQSPPVDVYRLPGLGELCQRRAWELVNDHAHRLPPIDWTTAPAHALEPASS